MGMIQKYSMEQQDNMFEKLKYILQYKLNPKDPDVDAQIAESRRNWILYMANRDGRYPVSEVNEKFSGLVSKVTINKDFQKLEEEGLIKREKDRSTGKSYLVPLFKDSGIAEGTKSEQRRSFALKWGLPIVSMVLALILFGVILFYSN